LDHSAEGILLTSWGDCGNHQPWATLYPPLFFGAHFAWAGSPPDEQTLIRSVDQWAFSCQGGELTRALIELGRLDEVIQADIPNNSLPWFTLFNAQPKELPNRLQNEFSSRAVRHGIEHMEKLLAQLPSSSSSEKGSLCLEEIRLGVDLSIAGLEKALSLMVESDRNSINRRELIERFESNWLKRARPGGLPESLALLSEALSSY
jgi:hypothetical protein